MFGFFTLCTTLSYKEQHQEGFQHNALSHHHNTVDNLYLWSSKWQYVAYATKTALYSFSSAELFLIYIEQQQTTGGTDHTE